MAFNSKTLDKLLNSSLIKSNYPMIDHIESEVIEDNNDYRTYDVTLNIHVNDPDMQWGNMHAKNFNPHYLIDNEFTFLLSFLSIRKRDIDQIFIRVIKPDGEVIYG